MANTFLAAAGYNTAGAIQSAGYNTAGAMQSSGYLEADLTFLEEHKLKLVPQDIREVQLAKGAIIAGIYTLINKAGITIDQVEKVFLAGGFGYAISPQSAVKIGLLPEEFEKKVIRAGNTAGLGARLFLHSEEFRKRANKIAQHAQHFDLSVDMDLAKEEWQTIFCV